MRGPVNIDACFADVDGLWSPLTIAVVNDYDVRIAEVEGEFVWHAHDDTDEFFQVLDGELRIDLDGRETVVLGAGEVFVVPAGVRHRPHSSVRTRILLLEPSSVVNTGDEESSALTSERRVAR